MNGILIFAVVSALVALFVYARIRCMNRREAEEECRRIAERAAKERAAALVDAQNRCKAAERNAAKAKPVEPTTAQAVETPQAETCTTWRDCFKGNNMFAGECVAFTGTLSGMTRRQAIQAVEANGGKAFDRMPVCTTLLVVADKGAGKDKLDLADKRIGQVRKITERAFKSMLTMQLTVTPEELEAAFAAHNA